MALSRPRLPGPGRGLGLAGQSKVGELELGALRVGAEQLGLLGVQEGEGLRAGAVRLHTHGGGGEEEKRRFPAHPSRPGLTSGSPGAALRERRDPPCAPGRARLTGHQPARQPPPLGRPHAAGANGGGKRREAGGGRAPPEKRSPEALRAEPSGHCCRRAPGQER